MGRNAAAIRQSVPPYMSSSMQNALGFIAKRNGGDGSNATALRSLDSILLLARTQPNTVLSMLPEVSPEIAKALWNKLRLACHMDSVRLKAMKKVGSTNDQIEDPVATQAVKDFFNKLPLEIGGFTGALSQNFLMVLFSGSCATEGVPGPRGTGLIHAWPIDTLTTQFRRNQTTGLVEIWQRQRPPHPAGVKVLNGFVQLPQDRVFWRSIDGLPDDPYGRAPLASALNPFLDVLAFLRGLLKAWHRVGTPKLDIGFDYEMFARIAREQLGMVDADDIRDYIAEELADFRTQYESLQEDDTFLHDIKSKVDTSGSASAWPAIDQMWALLRWRLIMGLDEMPTLMGVVEGSTETWSSVDWQIYSKGLIFMVQIAAAPLIACATLHLQLMGIAATVVAEYAPIRANQRMVDAQSEQLEIQNAGQKELYGYITHDEASIEITGTAAVKEMDKEALGLTKPPPPAGGGGSSSGSGGKSGPSKAT